MDDNNAMAKSHLPELARDSRLETERTSERTVHFFTESPTIVRQEVWKQTQRIGAGGFGTVFLEQCVAGHQPGNHMLRAVKVIHLSGNQSNVAVYGRELEALTKFSQRKVCNLHYPTCLKTLQKDANVFVAVADMSATTSCRPAHI